MGNEDKAAIDDLETSLRQTLSAMANEIREVNLANGWAVFQPSEWDLTYKVPGILALIHSEVSEALEAFRKNDEENFLEELADVLIRVLDCAGGMTNDFDEIVKNKIEKNRGRSHRHGNKRV